MNAKDITLTNIKLRCLIYGEIGTGKTVFACSFPKPYVFDFDNGMLSVRGKDIEYDVYADIKDSKGKVTSSAYNRFQAKINSHELDEFDTIIIDSISNLQEYAREEILRMNNKDAMTFHEWQMLVSWIRTLFLSLTKADKHIVAIAHEQKVADENSGVITLQPLLVGKVLPETIPNLFDEVYRMQVKMSKVGTEVKYEYQFATKKSNMFPAKSRLNVFDPVETWTDINPFEYIMEKVRGGEKK